ncbi:MAG TPA: hypothetical protein P5230_00565 [Candidatus Magasanikbacteria bacterium]|nr:hypothetical protein [Candidatus Magasanikbacteria bacterium]
MKHYLQWGLDAGEGKYSITNLSPDGKRQFYEVIMGQYGQPLIVAEPDRAFPCPTNLAYVNAKGETAVPDEKIAGIICSDGKRFSLTNAEKKGIKIEVNADGSIQIDNEVWWIVTLFQKDRNRIINYDAYLSPVQPEKVKILELADLSQLLCS